MPPRCATIRGPSVPLRLIRNSQRKNRDHWERGPGSRANPVSRRATSESCQCLPADAAAILIASRSIQGRRWKLRVSDRRQNILDLLRDLSPRLAGIYRMALSALDSAPEEGCESARISVICHCMRELMMGLPAVLSEKAIPRPNPTSGVLTMKLPSLLEKHPGVDLTVDQDLVPVPKEVAQAIDRLISTASKENGRNRFNDTVLVTGADDSKHPAVDQWRAVYRFFVGWAHLDRNHASDRELPSDSVLLVNVRVVEDVIEVRTAAFFENLQALRGLLESINASGEEDE